MKKFFGNKWVWVGIIVLLGGGWLLFGRNASKSAVEVKYATAERKDIVESITVSGKIVAGKQATLTFPASGKLAYVNVKEGDAVKAGQWMAALDNGDLNAAVTKAWYTYLAADANAKEIEDSVKGHSGDETFAQKNDRVAAQTARDSAYENWLSSQRAVGLSVLKSPFSGVVTDVSVSSAGDIVNVTDGITVVDPNSLYFSIEVDETDLGKVTLGQRVVVTLDAFENKEFEGQIDKIGFQTVLSDSGATVVPVRVSISAEGLVVGLNGDAEIVLQKKSDVLVLPVEAVDNGEVELEDKTKRKIETGIESDTEVEVTSGIDEGTRVIVK